MGCCEAEAAGKRFLYRTGASFVRARAGLRRATAADPGDLLGADAPAPLPGLVVVGSHVRRTGEQLARLLELPGVVGIEVDVPAVLDDATSDAAIDARRRGGRRGAAARRDRRSSTPRAGSSRRRRGAQLAVSRAVSAALVEVVARPRAADRGLIVGKGGITSSDVGTEALGARRALVLGQIRPGIPVWRLGPETRYPGLPYVVFPGNVGGPETLAEVVSLLRGA